MGMRPIPDGFADRSEWMAVVVRTDHSDDAAWDDLVGKLSEPPDNWDDFEEMESFLIDGPEWAGASVDEVLAAVAEDPGLSVVFVADRRTMTDPDRPLLAVTTTEPDSEYYESTVEFGREFRIVPPEAHALHGNLELANMDFEEFSAAATRDPGQVFRGF